MNERPRLRSGTGLVAPDWVVPHGIGFAGAALQLVATRACLESTG